MSLFSRYSYIITVLILLHLLPCNNYSRTKTEIENTQMDSVKFRKLFAEIRVAMYINPDSAFQMLEPVKTFVQKPENLRFKASYLHYIGLIYQIKGEIAEALPYFQKAYQIFKDLSDTQYSNWLMANVGICYMMLGNYNTAKENLTNALKYFEAVNDSNLITMAYLNLSFIANDVGDEKEFESVLNKALLYAKTYQHKSKIYNNLGEMYFNRKLYANALQALRFSVDYSVKAKDNLALLMGYHNIGRVHMMLSQNDSAFYFYNKVISQEKICPDYYLLALVYRDMANLAKNTGELLKVEQYMSKSLDIATANKLTKVIADNYTWLSDWYATKSNFKNAYHYKSLATIINDSLFNAAKNRQIKEIEAIYQNEKKQAEIQLLSDQNNLIHLRLQNNKILIISLSALILFIVALSILFIRQNKLKANSKALDLEHKLLRSQMNPHFIFNALAAIQNQVLQKPALEAAGYLSGFAKLMRGILYSSRSETISLSDEIDTLKEYLNLQKLRMKEKLQYHFSFNLSDDINEIAIPPMLMQPFIENAIEHGIAKKEIQEGTIWISISQENNKLNIIIEDDGIGITQISPEQNTTHKSLATKITDERLHALSKTFKSKFNFVLGNKLTAEGKINGAKVILELPLLFISN